MLLDFKSLHVLILMGEDLKELPSSIGKLIHLRLVDTSSTRIENLPDSIGRLVSLQSLPYFQVGHEKGRGIVELGSLKNLKGTLEIHNLEKVCDKEDAKRAHLFQKQNLCKLKFAWSELREGDINDENVLEGLQPHPNLKSLEINGFNGRNFPLWILKMAVQDDLGGQWIGLNHLMEIRLTNCKECEEIPMLGRLPYLKRLYLHDLTHVRSLVSSFYGVDNYSTQSNSGNGVQRETITLFPMLEKLELSKMPNLIEWGEATNRALTSLPCEMIASCAASLETLALLGLSSLINFAEVFRLLPKMLRLTHLAIGDVPKFNYPPMEIGFLGSLSDLYVLPCLDSLDLASFEEFLDVLLRGVKSLRSLWLTGHDWNLSSLKMLRLWRCKKLKSLSSVSTMQKLEKEVKDCPLLEQ
ncbi:UNVERIFIED_CONTAM: hypothetical protein Sangu_2596100 [Sesamum angustifolium]|uniref:R13L1/DRL21-like LRR repeat region domain-containing protein n=1 Tax=Sesamum angustifolium TaxID=2727405 RepID=A0AAW2J5S9_9LAMI